jgi:hypothetical protein
VTESFFELAAFARDRYLRFYREVIEELKGDASLALEVLVQPDERTSPHPFCLTRVDALVGGPQAPRVQRVVDARCDDVINVTLASGLEVHQDAFSWEALRLAFSASTFRVETLEAWLRSWLDSDELREPDASGLSGVVHDLAWTQVEDAWQLHLDLGSAPLAAFQELLGILSAAGVTRVDVSRHDLEDGDA